LAVNPHCTALADDDQLTVRSHQYLARYYHTAWSSLLRGRWHHQVFFQLNNNFLNIFISPKMVV